MPLRVLRVHLDTSEIHTETIPEEIEANYPGGRALAVWLLTKRLPTNAGPMSRTNILVFSAGLMAGTGMPGTGGFIASTRSPLTGALAHSWADGEWGGALRRAGYDALMIDGQHPDWCQIVIDGAHVSIQPAAELLGADTRAVAAQVQAHHGDVARVVCVGPAGEAGVAYSSIVADGRFLAEPAGTGAVMAHKRIKAVVVRGGTERQVASPARAKAAYAAIKRRVEGHARRDLMHNYESLVFLPFAKEWGALTSHNGKSGRVTHLAGITRSIFANRYPREWFGCDDALIACHSDYIRPDGSRAAFPTLECVAGFGARCGLASPDAIIAASEQCLSLGLDPVSTSAAIAFLIECQEEKLSKGVLIPWGDEDAILQAIGRLAHKQEKRDLLSLGVGEMCEIFWGSATFAPHVKGLAMPALDPRALHEVALAMATSPIGGDYRYAMTYEELLDEAPDWLPDEPSHPQAVKGKVARLIWHERFAVALDVAGICRRFALMSYMMSPAELAELLASAMGRTLNGQDIARLGERIVTLERVFMRENSTVSTADTLPPRWREEPLGEGRAAGHLPALHDLLQEYYKRHGWNEQGEPPARRLIELAIDL